MRSTLPKVLHACAGLPLIVHVVRTALSAGAKPVVVVVSPATQKPVTEALEALCPDAPITYAVQQQPRGTGDAVRAGLLAVPPACSHAVILYGDVPLLQKDNLLALREAAQRAPLALLTAVVPDPTGYGRVVRDATGQAQRIVEHKDASPSERALCEVNVGVYWSDVALLRQAVAGLSTNNAQQELYLTDIVAHARAQGPVQTVAVADIDDMRGVNSRIELGEVERIMRARLVRRHQAQGATFLDPKRAYVGVDVTLGQDVLIGLDVALHGNTVVEDGAVIEGPTVVRDSRIEASAHVHAFCHLERAHVATGAVVGPYARLRPGADVGPKARVGNFVEIKNATLATGAKVNHLAYVGDAQVGAGANLGAGTITCNYDGFHKHRTIIGDGAFIGSNSTLVAPLTIGAQAFVAAGSTITQDVPSEALAFGRARQAIRDGQATVLRARLAGPPNKQAPTKGH
jgi:bifunctional UDP-N-acetylglucosamine pyrophosphorylase/glucosamine-1-phosphate N-acetyltransferase